MEFQENEGKEGKAAYELRVGTGTGGYRGWRVVNKPKEVGNLFVYCSASEEPGAGYNPGAAEVMHHGVAHGEGRVQPAHLGIRCSPAFGGCGGEGIMIEDGRGLEEIIRTRGDLEDALRSRYVRPRSRARIPNAAVNPEARQGGFVILLPCSTYNTLLCARS